MRFGANVFLGILEIIRSRVSERIKRNGIFGSLKVELKKSRVLKAATLETAFLIMLCSLFTLHPITAPLFKRQPHRAENSSGLISLSLSA